MTRSPDCALGCKLNLDPAATPGHLFGYSTQMGVLTEFMYAAIHKPWLPSSVGPKAMRPGPVSTASFRA
jgi:hypothetical protein